MIPHHHSLDPTFSGRGRLPDGRVLSFARIVSRALWCASLWSLAVILAAGPARAVPPQLLWSFQGNGSLQAIDFVPDIDGDGGPEVVFEGYENGPSGVDHVFCIRGRSSGVGEVIWSARPIGGVSSGGGWGANCLRTGPDLTGDGFPELLLGTAWGGRTAYALNGLSGSTVWSYDTYAHYGSSYAGWIYAMDSLGQDLTGDGVPEVVFCSGSNNDRVHCVNGATGEQIWVFYGQDAFFDIRSCQDITGDGVRDVVAALGDNTPISPRLIALSGANGAVAWQAPLPAAIWNLVFIDDLDSDGIREVVPSVQSGSLYCLSGRTGATVWTSPIAAQQRVAALQDVNGDGVADIAVGFFQSPAVRACSGANGAVLWTAPASDWTWAVDRVDDCTGDGINDVAAGDFDGYVYLLDGVTGAVFWSWLNPTADKIMTIRGVPDLNGNGVPDVVAGTQLLYGGTGGDVYALEGNSESASVSHGPPADAAARLFLRSPSPAAGPVSWSLSTPEPGSVHLSLFASDGRLVRALGERPAVAGGEVILSWDGRDGAGNPVSPGVYLARASYNGREVSGRAVVLR